MAGTGRASAEYGALDRDDARRLSVGGNYEGAARFDGVRFTLFNPSTTTGIGNSFVTSLLERRDGDLWLATYGGGVSRLSGGRFIQYTM